MELVQQENGAARADGCRVGVGGYLRHAIAGILKFLAGQPNEYEPLSRELRENITRYRTEFMVHSQRKLY